MRRDQMSVANLLSTTTFSGIRTLACSFSRPVKLLRLSIRLFFPQHTPPPHDTLTTPTHHPR
ncbi:Protein of unknown function [Pyronema omphalodes CBS 100304]|uniref:Uncharacterized protein n=1 Tax=Pyronema omphalodes (strain CBS 100304) TaxID=1076935 RepID=U4L3B0_PYROM|nr:Protein of unknown function [Pyronema omphalodes CBS 100304]